VRPNAFLFKSAIAAALGGLLFGFDTTVIAGATRSLTALYHLTAAGLGLTVSSALFGTVPGALFAGMLGDRFGRRDSLRVLVCSTSSSRSAAPSLPIGIHWSAFGTSPRFHRRNGAGVL
jgi:MFS family permease